MQACRGGPRDAVAGVEHPAEHGRGRDGDREHGGGDARRAGTERASHVAAVQRGADAALDTRRGMPRSREQRALGPQRAGGQLCPDPAGGERATTRTSMPSLTWAPTQRAPLHVARPPATTTRASAARCWMARPLATAASATQPTGPEAPRRSTTPPPAWSSEPDAST